MLESFTFNELCGIQLTTDLTVLQTKPTGRRRKRRVT